MSIRVENVTHVYNKGLPDETAALSDVCFELEDNQFMGIIGHTGSGKSTLLQHLNGLLRPDSGSIVVDGVDITDKGTSMLEVRRKVGLVFQYPEYQLFEETVEKDVAFGPNNLGLEQDDIDERVRSAIELVGLDFDNVREKSPFDLSGGQKRRVAIAGVIAMRPKILILDEPTAGLDPHAHADILNMVQTIHERENNTIILVSHNMNDIAANSDMVLVMDNGRSVMFGTPQEVFAQKERLSDMGLSVPDTVRIAMRLKDRGFDLQTDVFTVSQAAEAISESINRKRDR